MDEIRSRSTLDQHSRKPDLEDVETNPHLFQSHSVIGLIPRSPDVPHTRSYYYGRQGVQSNDQHKSNKSKRDCYSRLKCKTQTAEQEMKRQYDYLKEEYYRVCQQEATLRNHIALLGAEIILMQTKAYHKCPASVRRINIDPITIQKINYRRSRKEPINNYITQGTKEGNGRYFIKKRQSNGSIPSYTSAVSSKEQAATRCKPTDTSCKKSGVEKGMPEVIYGDSVDRCFYFEIPSPVVAPPYIPQSAEKVTRHRLPKLVLPDIPEIKNKTFQKLPSYHMHR